MITRRLTCLCLFVLCTLVDSVSAQSTCSGSGCTPLFKMDCGVAGASFPNCGWTTARSTASGQWSRAFLSSGGPTSQDAVQVTHTPGNTSPCAQFSLGWTGTVEGSTPSLGSRRYVYYRWRVPSTFTGNKARHPSDSCTNDTGVDVKFIIQGSNVLTGTCTAGAGSDQRIIVNYTTEPSGTATRWAIGLGGGSNLISTAGTGIARGTWQDVIIELTSSTTATANDGGYKLWVNTNDYNSPTKSSFVDFGGFPLCTTGWTDSSLSDFSNVHLAPDGNHVIEIADYFYDDQFCTSFVGGSCFSGAGGGSGGSIGRRKPVAVKAGFSSDPALEIAAGVVILGLYLRWRQRARR